MNSCKFVSVVQKTFLFILSCSIKTKSQVYGAHVRTHTWESNRNKKETLMYDIFFISRLDKFANAKKTR